MRYFAQISYNGTNYHGWQVQPNANTVQAEVEKAFGIILKNPNFSCIGCGRTDTGVHASDFYLHFDHEESFDADKVVYKLNSLLPNDIAVYRIFSVDSEAHTRFDATSRTYQYHIHRFKNPFNKDQSTYHTRDLDVGAINKACKILFEYEDFTSFSKLHTDAKTNLCEIKEAHWEQNGMEHVFTISANRFLRNMVRAVVGTLLEVGEGKLTIEGFRKVIEDKSRGAAGKSVPAKGLFLTKVEYPYL